MKTKAGRTGKIIMPLFLGLFFPAPVRSEKIVNGVEVLTTIEELVSPVHSAVIVIDMQNEIVSTEGGYARKDKSAKADPKNHQIAPRYAEQVRKLKVFLDAARQTGLVVAYAEYIHQDQNGRMVVNGPEVWTHRNSSWVSKAVEGRWESKTVDELAPREGETVIHKSRADAFHNTYLEDLLKDKSIKTVLLTGTATSGCVFATAMGAIPRGYYPIIVKDCVDQDERTFDLMQGRFPLYRSDEIMAVWKKITGISKR
jgi:nicotinamidase-related amidase